MVLSLLATCLIFQVYAQEEPSLPPGLEERRSDEEEPALPLGLGAAKETAPEEPELPAGLVEEEPERVSEVGPSPAVRLPFDLAGFWEVRVGARVTNDPHQRDASLGETRLQLELDRYWTRSGIFLTTDFLYDPVLGKHDIDLEEGRGWIDLRSAGFSLSPFDFTDLKVGRQILTWGTGDLVFINDLFPKDWNAFLIGRDVEYLKAPCDAVKVSLFSNLANLDVVYTPRFDPDRFIDGRRISYWNSALARRAGRDAVVRVDGRDAWFDDDEIALRLHKNVGGYELAAYGYEGFWKSPGGMNPATRRATFPKLSVHGASLRGNVAKGIGNVEAGYYDSGDDRSGGKPFINNSEVRFLVGYEQEVARELTVRLQYYLEHMMDYGDYRRTLPPDIRPRDKDRHVLTLRLTKLLLAQNLELSLFTFYSPSDDDAYLRPRVHYKFTDHWAGEIGANVFLGQRDHTFFGQFEKNNNVYAGVRYSF